MNKLWNSVYEYRYYIGVDGVMYISFILAVILLFIFFS